jgi:hypothetical protein
LRRARSPRRGNAHFCCARSNAAARRSAPLTAAAGTAGTPAARSQPVEALQLAEPPATTRCCVGRDLLQFGDGGSDGGVGRDLRQLGMEQDMEVEGMQS